MIDGVVVSVSRSATHDFSKQRQDSIRLLAGLGVEGDAHLGATVKHRFLVRRDPNQPNLRQVHLLHAGLLDELHAAGFSVAAAAMGENILTRGIDLLGLPAGTRMHLGPEALVEVTGLRNPCRQIEAFQPGLLVAVLSKDEQGNVIRKAGIMSVVVNGGEVRAGDAIRLELPPPPHDPLPVV